MSQKVTVFKMATFISWKSAVAAAITLIFIGLIAFALYKSTPQTKTHRPRCGNSLIVRSLLNREREKSKMQDSFYITLLSNSLKSNTVAHFFTHLPTRMSLSGDWEVGLAEISYTKSWYNFPVDTEVVMFYIDTKLRINPEIQIPVLKKIATIEANQLYSFKEFDHTSEIGIRAGYYQSQMHLCEVINAALMRGYRKKGLASSQGPPKITINQQTGRFRLESGVMIANESEQDVIFSLSSKAMELLGFDNEVWKLDKQNGTSYYLDATNDFDFYNGIWTLQVMSNLADYNIVTDTYANLLRTVEVPPRSVPFGDQFTVIYNTPHYIPLLRNEFEVIEIHIRTDDGRTMPFQSGRSIVKLHFRKKQPRKVE